MKVRYPVIGGYKITTWRITNAYKKIDLLNYSCKVADKRDIFFLWRPFLKDPGDDMVLELAVEADDEYIITYNLDDFKGIEQFGVDAITPKQFLIKIDKL